MSERPRPYQESPTPERPSDPRIDAAVHLLEQGVERLMETDQFKQYLEFSAKFHRFSTNNQLLIWMQKPDATQVMGYGNREGTTGWKSLGRQVQAGEQAIKIFAPMIKKDVDLSTGEIVENIRGFRLVNVFDVSSTEGEDLPEPVIARELEGSSERGRKLYGWTRDHLANHGVPVFRTDHPTLDRGAKGVYLPHDRKIYIKPGMSEDMSAKTLTHEAAHFTADHKGFQDRSDVETVAEGAAFVTATHFGLDTADYSFAYVSSWAKDREVLRANIGQIQATAKTLITGIEGVARRELEDEQ